MGVPGSGRRLVGPRSRWRTLYGTPAHGATPVRPDRFIAWRSTSLADTDELTAALLMAALRTVLCRSGG